MSDNINSMNFKQLKNEVQSLRDEIAIMKRKYEDIIYNLDTDNFSQRVVKQGKDMYTKIEQNAEGISIQAEKVEENKQNLATLKITADEIESEVFEENEDGTKTSRITQTADAIRSEIKSATETLDEKFENYSTTEQTESKISAKVKEYVTNTLDDKDYVTNAELEITANGIRSTVTSNYNTLSGDIDDVWSYASGIEQTASRISTRVGKVENGQYTQNGETYTLFEQTADKFTFTGNVNIRSTDEVYSTVKIDAGHLQLYPYGSSDSIVDLGMYYINNVWQPRMRFGQGTGDGVKGTGWIYKDLDNFGMVYNTNSGKVLAIDFNSTSNAIYIRGNVEFSGGTVTGLPAGGTGGTATAVFG